ncbi:MAG: glutamate--cysteine ligase [Paracoccaceae bacterium]
MSKLNSIVENKNQLIQFFEDGCKPKSSWKIGTEHEKFGFIKSNLKPLPYKGHCSVLSVLNGLIETFGWKPIEENKCIIGLKKDTANITLEPGGQLELSGALLDSVHETCFEVATHLAEVKTVADRIGAGFIGLGSAPEWMHKEMPIMPKDRYKLMAPYMEKVGSHGTQMMFRTCTVQVNLDYSSESDMIKKMRVGLALQPVATALFAASPFFEGKITGFKSYRSRIWHDTDKSRTGMLPFVFDEGYGFESWVNYALKVPMYFIKRDNRYINAMGLSFQDFLEGKLSVLPNEKPKLSDWIDHLSTIFPEARLKQYIEMRGADAGPWSRICALPAFWVGIIYDEQALDTAWNICKEWTADERYKLYKDVSKLGFDAIIRDKSVKQLAHETLLLSENGLKNRKKMNIHCTKQNECEFLSPLFSSLDKGMSLADEILIRYNKSWSKDIKQIYSEYSY